ncbi:MAG: glycosyltransferase family 4 protein [Ardenticatenaceae bacterium]|nr:glycosyltransferase family 4 protein [Ardenticatenaceae bacterium]
MRIGLLAGKYAPDPGGLAVSARRLARGLQEAGHEVVVYVPGDALLPGQRGQTADDGIVVWRFGLHKRADDTHVDWFEGVVQLHEERPFTLLHAYYLAGAGQVAVYAARYLGIPSIVSARGNDLERSALDPAQTGGIVWALARAGAVTAVSHDLAQKAKALADCHPIVIHNGVDANLFTPAPPDAALRAELGLKPDTPVLGFVGEARLKKGLTILLPAFAQVAAQAEAAGQPIPALLLIGGVRKDNKDIVRVFKAQNPTLKVRVIDNVAHADLPRYYNLLDINLLPSLRDGLPNSLLEGLACGKATIATRVGGMLDVLEHGVNGWLIAPGDVAELVEAIGRLLAAGEERERVGRNGRQTILAHFTPEQELQANLSLYKALK